MLILKRRRLFSPAVHCAIVSSDAAETTAFLARTSGLSGTEIAAYKAMINGMVSDGVWSKLDALYIFATKDTTTANLNLISTSYGLTTVGVGSLTFAADHGYTGVTASGGAALDTGLVLTAATQYGLNSGAIGGYVLNNRTTSAASVLGGVSSGNLTYLRTHNSSGNAEFDVNSSTFSAIATAASQGSWFVNRSAASGAGALTAYRNGSSILATSVAKILIPPTYSVYISALNNGGSVNSAGSDQIAAFWIGGGFSAADVANFSNRLNAYMTALGINVY